MNKILGILVLVFGVPLCAAAQDDLPQSSVNADTAAVSDALPSPDSLWNAANQFYTSGNYPAATAIYTALINKNIANPYLYYNAANAFYKQNEIAKAILFYEKALKINPNDEDIQHNLRTAENFAVDKVDAVPVFFAVRWLNAIPQWFNADTWGYLSLLTFAAMLALLLLININKHKRTLIILSVSMLVLAFVTMRIAVTAKNNTIEQTHAIVMLPVTTVKSSPDQSSTDLFILHEGTKVQMLETIGVWTKIRIADGNQGWIAKNSIEKI